MQKERPLSPHLQVYRPQMTSMLTIMHRGTGVFLALGTPLLVYWLVKLAAGPLAYAELQQSLSHWFPQLILVGWSFALFYHLANGIRHLFWDIGKGFELEDLHRSGYMVLTTAVVLTTITVFFALNGGAS